jgi:hypothetical protein
VLLGAPDVLPQQLLRNPTSDEDPDVPSDLPHACHAPASDDPGDFVGPVRVVGRLLDLLGATGLLLLQPSSIAAHPTMPTVMPLVRLK